MLHSETFTSANGAKLSRHQGAKTTGVGSMKITVASMCGRKTDRELLYQRLHHRTKLLLSTQKSMDRQVQVMAC